jgi:cytochrome c peroxidase
VALTGPWGHAGAYGDLTAFVVGHADPRAALVAFDRSRVVLAEFDAADWRIMGDPVEVAAIANAVKIDPVALTAQEVAELVAFLGTLTDTVAQTGRLGVPKSVPSGLTVPNP